MIKTEIGNSLHGFKLMYKEPINDISSVGYMFEHIKSGAKLMYIENDDDNRVFFISFRTPPVDDCGTPHIIEHSVLCGSKKYPVKDPFNELAKGSLNTYLNALTYSDKTVYPIASRNEKDFQNLMDVYLDAVFNPMMLKHKEIFMQEGHHLHLENKQDSLCEKGVVYNEMKGAYSDPDRYIEGAVNTSLFTESPYKFESGGDPDKIPELTYEKFIEFYKNHYHPSNSYIYLFGKMDIEERMEYIDREYLSAFDKISVDTEIKPQQPIEKAVKKDEEYPVIQKDGSNKEAMYAAAWMTGKSYDAETTMGLSILSYILLDTNASPVKKALTENGFCSNAESWYDSSMLDTVFMISAKGAKENSADEFEKIITDSFNGILAKGLDKELVESAVNAFDFMFSEENYGYKPRGLAYGLKAMDIWLHKDNPFESFRFKKQISSIREKAENGYFEELIRKYIVDNNAKVFVSLQPKEGMQAEADLKEKQKFDAIKSAMSETELENIVNETKALLSFQSQEDDLSVMPSLKLSDISKKADIIKKTVNDNIIFVPQVSNDIVYTEMLFDVNSMPKESYGWLGLLSELFGKLDTEKYSFTQLPTKIDMYTGGISASCNSYVSTDGKIKKVFAVSGKALSRNIGMLAELINQSANRMDFEKKENIHIIINDIISKLENYLAQSGHMTSAFRALSYYNESFKFKDETGGIGFFKFLCEIEKSFDENIDTIIYNLKAVAKAVFSFDRLTMAISCDDVNFEIAEKSLTEIFGSSDENCVIKNGTISETVKSEGIITPGKIQYVAKAVDFGKNGFKYNGKLLVLKNIIDLEYLWNVVRVQGGAYGCGCNFLKSGNMYMYSYRDPNLKRTLDVYDKSAEFISGFNADEKAMTNYIIGAINSLDRPLSREQKIKQAIVRHIAGITDGAVQKEREEVLSSTIEDMHGFAPLLASIKDSGYICVMGNGENINSSSELFEKIINLK